MAKPKTTGLGKGLDAIFSENDVSENGTLMMLRVSDLEPNPNQPRHEFDPDALAQLAQSITVHGLIQPIVVRSADSEGYYQIIAGERRWRASKMAGLTEVPVVVMDLDDKKSAQIALIENVQRAELNPIEEANAYRSLIDEYGMTQEEISRQIGKNRSTVANMLRLMELPGDVTDMVKNGTLSAGHARTLLGLNDKSKIASCAETVIAKNLSVRQTESYVKLLNKPKAPVKVTPPTDIDYTAELARKMTAKLGHRVIISKKPGNGRVEISFTSDAELDDIVSRLFGDNIFDE